MIYYVPRYKYLFPEVIGYSFITLYPQYGPYLHNNSTGPYDVSNSLAHGLVGETIILVIQVHFKDLINF